MIFNSLGKQIICVGTLSVNLSLIIVLSESNKTILVKDLQPVAATFSIESKSLILAQIKRWRHA